MTDPLIDRDEIAGVISQIVYDGGLRIETADAIIAYLREVLTPEVLATSERNHRVVPLGSGSSYGIVPTAPDVYRRIFGEDK